MRKANLLFFAFAILSFVIVTGGGCGSSATTAEKQLKKGNNAKAIELLKQGIAGEDSTNPKAYALLAKAQYAEKKYLEATENVAKAKKLGLPEKEAKEMTVLFAAAWGIVTSNAITKYNEAITAIRKGEKDKAAIKLDSAKLNANASIIIQPDSSYGYTLLANVYVLKEDYQKAVDIIKKQIEKEPKVQDHYIQLSNIYTQYLAPKDTSLKTEAIKVLEAGRQQVGETPEIIRYLAIAYVANGRSHEAEEVTKKLVEKKPQDKFAHYLYGIALGTLAEKGQSEKYDECLAQYLETIKLDPKFEEAIYNYAYISFRKAEDDYNKNAQAFMEAEKKKKKKSKDPIVYTGHYPMLDAAIEKLKSLAEEKNKKEYWDLLSTVYAKKGDSANAEAAIKKANEVATTPPAK